MSKMRITVLPVVNSTNQYLLERTNTLKSGDACVAECQTQGRGQHGRRWISPFGNNIYLSLYWRLENRSISITGLSLMVSIVLAETLHRLGAKTVRVKWPNDLYLDNRKLGGILIEVSGNPQNVAHVVIGVGINLTMKNHLIAAGIRYQSWINLHESGIVINRNILIAELIDALCYALRDFEDKGFKHFVARWRALDNYFNRPVKLLIDNLEIQGIERGINLKGNLLLEQEGNLYTYQRGHTSLRR